MSCGRADLQPLQAGVRDWIRSRERADDILHEWQRLESEVVRDHGCISPKEASRRGLPQGKAMRLLDIEYRTVSRALRREAVILSAREPGTIADAMAKIELGLRIQDGDVDAEGDANIRDGFKVLSALLPSALADENFGPAD